MFEYAISCGEGTLLDYGMMSTEDFISDKYGYYGESDPETLMVWQVASPDCQTGQ